MANENYAILADKELFDGWKQLTPKIQQIAAIVQNDMVLPEEEINKWRNKVASLKSEIERLGRVTGTYLCGCCYNFERNHAKIEEREKEWKEMVAQMGTEFLEYER